MIVFTNFIRGKNLPSPRSDAVLRIVFEWIARFWRDPFTLLIACIAGLGTAHVLVRTATYGPTMTTASADFLSTALNSLAGEGWRDLTGDPMVAWPPLFPLLLTALGWVGIDPLAAGRWINAAAFGLTILVAGGWLRSHLRSRWLAVAATATIAVSLPLSHWASNFLTDSLFVLFTLIILMLLASFLNRRTDAPLLWWAAGFTALAALLRYPGVVLIGAGVLLLLPFARLKQTVVFGAISSLPLLAVLAHYWAVAGHLTHATGDRTDASGQSLSAGLSQIVEVFGEWVVPPHAPEGLAYLLWLAVGGVGLAGAAVVLRTIRMHRNGRRPDPEAVLVHFRLGPALPFGGFALIYLGFMVVVVPFTVAQGIDSRFLLPVYVPLLLTAVLLLDQFLSIKVKVAGWMVAARYGLASLVLLGGLAHGGYSTYKGLRLTAQAWISGYGSRTYNTPYWQHSETLNYLRSHRIDGRIYTNKPNLAWFWDRTAVPGKYQELPDEMGWTAIEAGTPIVWFDKFYKFYHQRYLSHNTDIRVLPGVEIVAELADGAVLRRTAAEPFDAQRHRARKQRYVEQLIQQAQAGERVVRADWDVYRTGRKLAYFKKPCAPADVQAKFVLHVIPADPADLPPHRQRYGFDNLGFYFDWVGVQLADQCMAIAHLPAYLIGRIRVGQWISGEDHILWEAEFSPSR